MAQIALAYPHFAASAEPRPMNTAAIWAIAADVRRQMFGLSERACIEPARLIERSQSLRINGVEMTTSWDIDHALTDDTGAPVLGEATVSSDEPTTVMVSINSEVAGGDGSLQRSSMGHELGHVVFDGPGWVMASRKFRAAHPADRRGYRAANSVVGLSRPGTPRSPGDWSEWRANEFMGALLAPPRLLHKEMVKVAAGNGIALVEEKTLAPLPVIPAERCDQDQIELLIHELAEKFGLSGGFIWTRLSKYRLLYRAG